MVSHEAETLRLLYGTDAPPAAAQTFQIGRLAFELVGGNLRTIRVDGIEVLRGIQYLVRDADWGTLSPAIHGFDIAQHGDTLVITYAADCVGPSGERLGYVTRIAAAGTTLDITVDAEALDDITVNRVGFCVLHAAGLGGAALCVEHGDGTTEDAIFPTLIAPWQPFSNIVALTHEQDGLRVGCRMNGGTFEMEDQRNWSDASYKTYVRPLAEPWPYAMRAGTKGRQQVRLEITGKARSAARLPSDVTTITLGATIATMPRIGLVITPGEADATCARRPALAELAVQDLLLSFDARTDGLAALQSLARAVLGSPARLTLECVVSGEGDLDAELARVADQVERAGLRLHAIAVYPAPDLQSTPPGSAWPACAPLADVYAAARRAFPALALGGGMYGYFTELNRKRPPLELLDFIAHATCPIVHAADDLSVMQSLGAVPHIMRSVRAIGGAVPYRLGPVTIGMRQNPYGGRTIPNPDRERIPMAMADPRQDGLFAAAWTIGYAAATAEGAPDVLTLGALTGPLGLLGDHRPRPVFAAVAALAALAGQPRRACLSSAPDTIAAIAGSGTVLLANLTAEPRRVRVTDAEIGLAPFQTAALPIAP